jgi:hypothetical protein
MPASIDEIRFHSASLSIHHAGDVFFAVTRAAVEEVGGPHAQISLTIEDECFVLGWLKCV